MHFNCPNCRQRLAIEDNRGGEQLPCPACHRQLRVPLVWHLFSWAYAIQMVHRWFPFRAMDRRQWKGSLAGAVEVFGCGQMSVAKSRKSAGCCVTNGYSSNDNN